MERSVKLGVAAIAVHLALASIHSAAHIGLHVLPASAADAAAIYTFIFIAPIGAGALLVARRVRAGAWLLLAGALGSLAIGTHHHFMVESPDHVAHLPPGAWRPIFQATAALLFPADIWGCIAGGTILVRMKGGVHVAS